MLSQISENIYEANIWLLLRQVHVKEAVTLVLCTFLKGCYISLSQIQVRENDIFPCGVAEKF